jgi:hypothetical protein
LPDGNLISLRRVKVKRVVALGLTLLTATAAFAHHSFARDYAEDKQVSLEGDIVSFEYRNPHAWVYFMAGDERGVMRRFGAEWANPRRLEQQGIGADDLRPGDHVIVTGSPNRSASNYTVHLKSIRRTSDGWSWPAGRGRTR